MRKVTLSSLIRYREKLTSNLYKTMKVNEKWSVKPNHHQEDSDIRRILTEDEKQHLADQAEEAKNSYIY